MIDLISPLRIVIVYVICGVAWVYCSDSVLLWIYRNPSPDTLTQLQHIKGISYILFSAGLLLLILKKCWKIIRTSELAYVRIFETSPQPMWIYDKKNYRFLQVNDAALNNYGYSREEFLKMTILDIRPEEDIPKILANNFFARAGFSRSGTWRHLRKDGSLMHVNVQAYGTIYEGHDAEVVFVWDITDQYHAEQALKEQKGILSTIINSTEDLIWSVDCNKRFVAFNNAFHDIVQQRNGLSLERGHAQSHVYNDTQLQRWTELYDRSLAGEKIQILEERRTEKGEQVFMDITFNPITEEGRIVGVACFARDVTAPKQQQIALKKALDRYETLNLATNDAIWDWDLVEDKIVWNNNVQLIFGYKYLVDDESHWENHIHPDDLHKVKNSLEKALGDKRTHWSQEFRFLRSDRTYRYVHGRAYIHKNEQGVPVRMIGSMQDIQDKKMQLEEIKKLSLVASLTANPVVITDPEAHIEWVNKSFELLSGYSLEDIQGMHPSDFLHGEGTNPETENYIDKKMKAGEHCSVEILNYNQWKEPYWVLMDITPVVDGEGNIDKFIVIQTDITEKKKFMEQLEERNKDLMEVAYISSHKLRRPVASMLGIIGLMDKENPANPENTQLMSFIEKLTDEMDAMLHILADKCNYIYLRNQQSENGHS